MKLGVTGAVWEGLRVAPSRARELKLAVGAFLLGGRGVAPSRARELKPRYILSINTRKGCRALTGA